jgi:hypothetical protein
MAIPTKDSLLVQWSANADAKLTASPATWGYDAAFATSYSALHDAYVDAYNAMMQAREDGTRSESLTATKDSCKLAVLQVARQMYANVQKAVGISDTDKILLGVHVPDVSPTPQPVPALAPQASVTGINGDVVTVRLRDAEDPDRRARPKFTAGASIFSFVGEAPPSDPGLYKFEGNFGETTVDITFPDQEPGTKVFIVAAWFNNRKESGPGCTPIQAVLNYPASVTVVG